ncbi:MAG: hypothetical protein JWQ20_1147 [Conexibacter sp.]|nr:hypothetical protein [Conexibacter sp.]
MLCTALATLAVGLFGPVSSSLAQTQLTPTPMATGTARCTTQGSAIANYISGYAIGNCLVNQSMAVRYKASTGGVNFYGGYVAGAFQGCGWIRDTNTSIVPEAISNCDTGTNQQPQYHEDGEFMEVANCLPRTASQSGTSECTDGQGVTLSQDCPAYANIRPWTGGALLDRQTDIHASATVGWRYIANPTIGGEHYVMVHRLDDAAASTEPRWVFVPRGCLPSVLPVTPGKHYYCPSMSAGDNQQGQCTNALLDTTPQTPPPSNPPPSDPPPVAAPANLTPPSVTLAGAVPLVGVTQGSIVGVWANGPTSYAYEWRACAASLCSAISGATSATYTPTAADLGKTLTVTVVASNSGGSTSATSSASPIVADLETAASPDDTSASAVRDADGRTDVFARGADNTLRQAYWSGASASRWYWYTVHDAAAATEPALASPPAVVRDPVTGRTDAFARGADGTLWQAYWSGAGASQWHWYKTTDGTADGPPLASAPTVVRNPATGRIDVFVRGTDNALWQAYWSGTDAARWYWYKITDGAAAGPALASAPNATVNAATGRIDVFARGTDNALWQAYWSGVDASQWHWYKITDGALDGPALAGTPTVNHDYVSGRIDVFSRGADGALWQGSFSGSAATRWYWYKTTDGPSDGPALASSPSVSRNVTTGRIDVFARGGDNALWQAYWPGGSANRWYWYKINDGTAAGPALASAPTVLHDHATGRFDVFARGADNTLWQGFYGGDSATRWYWYQTTDGPDPGPGLA